MAKRTNSQTPRGTRAAGSKPSGSSKYVTSADQLATGRDPRENMTQVDRSTVGNGKPYAIPTNAR